MRLLLAKGADLNAKTNDGRTAMSLAANDEVKVLLLRPRAGAPGPMLFPRSPVRRRNHRGIEGGHRLGCGGQRRTRLHISRSTKVTQTRVDSRFALAPFAGVVVRDVIPTHRAATDLAR